MPHSADDGGPVRDVVEGAHAPILLVEDDLQLRLTIQSLLELEGYAVATAADGQEALEQARRQRPSLVLLDWGLPILNGAEVATGIHQSYADAVPIVLLTADGRSAEKARQVRARDYLNKPFELEELVTIVRRALDGPLSSP
jgi:DNA-binding response OmpR family regulator